MELVDIVRRHSRLFTYFNRHDAPDGSWEPFFLWEPLVYYASIGVIDVEKKGKYLNQLFLQLSHFAESPGERERWGPLQLASYRNVFAEVFSLFRQVNDWWSDFSNFTKAEDTSFRDTVRLAIKQRLAPKLDLALSLRRKTLRFFPGIFPRAAGLEGFETALWRLDVDAENVDVESEDGLSQDGASDPDKQDPDLLLKDLAGIVWPTFSTFSRLVHYARVRFDQISATPENLRPHFALYLNFIKQFRLAQIELNKLPERHLDYYYRIVLRQAPAPAIPDRVYVAFEKVPGEGRLTLPVGAALNAGTDASGRPMTYQTERALSMGDAAIEARAVVYLTNPSGATGDGPPQFCGFYAAPVANSTDGLGAPLPSTSSAWTTFGEDQAALPPSARTMPDGAVGFAISSPTLELMDGERAITLEVTFQENPSRPQPAISLNRAYCRVSYSGPDGWVEVVPSQIRTYRLVVGDAGQPVQLSLRIRLRHGAPACVNFNPKKLEGNLDPASPALRVLFLNPLFPLAGANDPAAKYNAAFRTARALRVRITTCVFGNENLVLENQGGLVAAGKPFPIFGAQPVPGNYLLVGKAEAFRKRLDLVKLVLRWQNLPQGPNGLADYYQVFLEGLTAPIPGMFQNAEYEVELDYLAGGRWRPWDSAGPANGPRHIFEWDPSTAEDAFAEGKPDGKLKPKTTFRCALSLKGNPRPDTPPENPPRYSAASETGFFRVRFTAPDYGFGQAVYPQVVTKIAFRNARTLMNQAKSETDAQAASPPAAFPFILLKTPAKQSGIRAFFWRIFHPGKTAYTFVPRLFTELKKAGNMPIEMAQFLEKHQMDPTITLKAIDSLNGKMFADMLSMEKIIAKTLGFGNRSAAEKTSILQNFYAWFRHLLHPFPSTLFAGLIPPPLAPLVPTLASVALSYRSETTLAWDGSTPAAPDRFYHLLPFGRADLTPSNETNICPTLIPSFEKGGVFHLGFAKVAPPETVSLLFQLEERSILQPTPKPDSPKWDYLAGNKWKPLDGSVQDETFGFLRTGIIEIRLASDVDARHEVMPSGLYWIRARTSDPGARLKAVAILSGATVAAWDAPESYPADAFAAHFATALPPGSVTGLAAERPAVKKVFQPLPSFGGKPPESRDQFYTRIAEQLRHKSRAVAPWDYERLLLESHHEVFYAKVIPSSESNAAGPTGEFCLMVLPTVKSIPAAVPPAFTQGELEIMTKSLRDQASPFARVEILNPAYDLLKVIVQVLFQTDQSAEYYTRRLDQDLREFISPWIYSQSSVTHPDATFRNADFFEFIQRRPYVVRVVSCETELSGDPCKDKLIVARSPGGMILSAGQHTIIVT